MDRLKRGLLLVPTAIAFAYAVVVGLDGVYIGFFISPEELKESGFGPQSGEWRMRSAGHYFWYATAVTLVFAMIGVGLKRLLASPAKDD